MTSREQKDALKRSLHRMDVPIRPSHLIETQSLVRESLRPGKRRLSFWEFLGAQVRFIGWKIWLFQAVTLLFICGIPFLLWGRELGSPRTAGTLLCCCSLLTFMTALPFLHRARRYGMCEVEMAARTSGLKQVGGEADDYRHRGLCHAWQHFLFPCGENQLIPRRHSSVSAAPLPGGQQRPNVSHWPHAGIQVGAEQCGGLRGSVSRILSADQRLLRAVPAGRYPEMGHRLRRSRCLLRLPGTNCFSQSRL